MIYSVGARSLAAASAAAAAAAAAASPAVYTPDTRYRYMISTHAY